jgi:hypothetical protein
MRQLSISEAWEQTKAIVAREGKLLAAVALALIVLPQVVLAVVGPPVDVQATVISRILYIAAILLGFVAQIALNRLAIGPSVTVADAIRQGLVRLISLFAALILVMIGLLVIAVLLAMVLGAAKLIALPAAGQAPPASFVAFLLLLTVLIFAIFQLVFPLAAVETGNPVRLLTRSWELGRGHYLRLLGFIVIVFVGVGIIAAINEFAIGSVILLALGRPSPGTLSALLLGLVGGTIQAAFTVVAAVMLARIYVQLAGRGQVQAGVPSSGT